MFRALSNRLTSHILAITLSATGAMPLAAAPLHGIKTHGKQVSIAVVPDLALSKIQRQGLRDFRSRRAFFGALYVSTDGITYQHFINWHDLDKVKTAARKGCETISKGVPCVLAAVSVPRGVDPNGQGTKGLGSWALRDLKTYRAEQVPGRYGAFAISNSAHQGYAYGWPSAAEARATALAYCKAAVARDFAAIGIQGRAFARTKGYDHCRIIDEIRPDS